VEKKLAIWLLRLAQEAATLAEEAGVLTSTAPGNVIRRPAFRKVRQLRRLLSFIEKLV